MSRVPTVALGLLVTGSVLLGAKQGAGPPPSRCGLPDPTTAAVRPTYPSAWMAAYPGSFSLDNVATGTGAACQLCHHSNTGGEPWNAYGWAVKAEIDGGSNITAALAAVEALDSDGNGDSNLEEITASTQPGWTEGANNSIFFKDGSTTPGLSPPAAILGVVDPISHPTVVHNGTGVNPVILTDTGGDPNTSPLLNSASEPFRVSLDCSTAAGPGVRTITVRTSLRTPPLASSFGEILTKGPILQKFPGLHSQNVVSTPTITLPYNLNFLGVKVYIQGFCGNGAGLGGFVSNALEHRVGT